ncbi:hypothetical protein TWF730_000583 [Orbilia blumenaviensis]|uniref:Uncharacterized protein n=1 Tax=Orbilia blumenaviensis TaxID=1796055 RepID=A0AAV9VT50_9PEZI
MDRKAQRIENIRAHLRDLIYDQHREQVDPKDITNTHRSRAPFQFIFKSDDPKQPKVSIASISQPDYDAIMRLITTGRLRAVRIDGSPDTSNLQQDIDLSQRSPTGTIETTFTPGPVEQLVVRKRESLGLDEASTGSFQTPQLLPTLPPFSTIMTHGSGLTLSPPQSTTQISPSSHSRSFDNPIGLSSFPVSTAMALDDPPGSPGTTCWGQIHKDLQVLRAGAAQWAEDLGDIQTRIEELSKLEKEVGRESSEVAYSEIEQLKSENSALRLRVEILEKENKNVTKERDFLKRLLDRIPSAERF